MQDIMLQATQLSHQEQLASCPLKESLLCKIGQSHLERADRNCYAPIFFLRFAACFFFLSSLLVAPSPSNFLLAAPVFAVRVPDFSFLVMLSFARSSFDNTTVFAPISSAAAFLLSISSGVNFFLPPASSSGSAIIAAILCRINSAAYSASSSLSASDSSSSPSTGALAGSPMAYRNIVPPLSSTPS